MTWSLREELFFATSLGYVTAYEGFGGGQFAIFYRLHVSRVYHSLQRVWWWVNPSQPPRSTRLPPAEKHRLSESEILVKAVVWKTCENNYWLGQYFASILRKHLPFAFFSFLSGLQKPGCNRSLNKFAELFKIGLL